MAFVATTYIKDLANKRMFLSSTRISPIFWRHFSTACGQGQGITIAIVGGGPAGLYTAQKLLRSHQHIRLDIFEKLAVPFGLVRYGVAPDHPEVKNVVSTFEKVLDNKNVRFFGNVDVGTSVKLEEIRSRYSAVILAHGASKNKALGLPGEDLPGVLSARDFVGWYNGHPDFQSVQPDLTRGNTAIVIGQGNVAMDCARILLTPAAELASTDITHSALQALRSSRINRVVCVGRRGPLQAAFTIKELREMTRLAGSRTVLSKSDAELVTQSMETVKADTAARGRKRLTALLASLGQYEPPGEGENIFEIMFCRRPVEFVAKAGRVNAVVLEKTLLEGPWQSAKSLPTGNLEVVESSLVLCSVGLEVVPIPGCQFDRQTGTVPNCHGLVQDTFPPLFCVGWAKTGPRGIIATTMNDAYETAEQVSKSIEGGHLAPLSTNAIIEDTPDWLRGHGVRVVDFEGWKKIEAFEKERGQLLGKPLEKLINVDEMLDIAGA